LAYHLAIHNPEIIMPGLLFCSAFVEAGPEQVNPMLNKATKYLEGKIGNDPMLLADLKTLSKLLGISVEMPTIDIEKHRLLKVAITGFRNGLQVAQGQKVSMLRRELEIASRECAREVDREYSFDLKKFEKDLDEMIDKAAKETDRILSKELNAFKVVQ